MKKMPLWFHFKPKQVGKGCERDKIKFIIPFRSVPTRRVIENSKKIAKKFKKLKNTIVGSFQAKIGRKTPRKRENKNYPSVLFLPKAWSKIAKKWQKNSKIPLWAFNKRKGEEA